MRWILIASNASLNLGSPQPNWGLDFAGNSPARLAFISGTGSAGKRLTCQPLPLQWSISATSYKRYSIALKVPKAHLKTPFLTASPFTPLLSVTLPYNENGIFFRKQSTVAAGASACLGALKHKSSNNQLSMLLLPVGWQWQKSLAVFQSQFPD